MEVVKKTDDYTIFKKKSGRYGVKGKNNKWINGDDKIKILADEGLIKLTAKAPAPVEEEAPTQETISEDAPAQEATAE